MFSIDKGTRLFVCTRAVDMRKGIFTLYNMVLSEASIVPSEGDCFIWFNKSRNSCKILRWYGDSYLLYQRRLSKGKFDASWLDGSVGYRQVAWAIFLAVMEGIDLRSVRITKRERF